MSFRLPQGHFVRNLGGAGDKETETEVLLLEHDVPHQPFSQAVLSFLPKTPWSVTEEVKPDCIVSVKQYCFSPLVLLAIVLCIRFATAY